MARTDRNRRMIAPLATAMALAAAACTTGAGRSPQEVRTIPQPPQIGDLPVAPAEQRVDLEMPTFSNPAQVTNPLHPTAGVRSVLMVGTVDGKEFRTEVTTLPDTRVIEWGGQRVETVVSQYVAYLDGRLHEVAYDFYAQADDGSVWYFGEDVFNFVDGAIANTHGTWIAGKDGPAAMIMPGNPSVGDTYRPENVPGLVFEEVRVKSVDRPLKGPMGRIDGGLLVEELHMDGTYEDKTFAPGYGEFYTAGGGDVEALAMAVPTDGASGPVPEELATLADRSVDALEAALAEDWRTARRAADRVAAAWDAFRGADIPRTIEPRMTRDVRSLLAAFEARDAGGAGQAAIDTARWAYDLQLRHRPVMQVDRARLDLWAAQMILDARAGDADAVRGDLFSIDYHRDRIQHTWSEQDAARINLLLEELHGAVGEEDLKTSADLAGRLREMLAGTR
ncbi:MAG TPA: hypothetical protein VJ868_09300 [Actinomycetota bacterium]|nr:hypothetical protein [Actinomycetota bacterium]